MASPVLIMVALIVGLLIVTCVVAYLADTRRTQAFEQVAGALGLRFELRPAEVLPRVADLPLFQRGRARQARRLLAGGRDDEELWVFDYRYTTGGGKNSTTHRQMVAVFPSMPVDLPEFQLRPENIFDKIGTAFGYRDIDFGEHPAFSSRYLLRGTDETAVRGLFDAGLIEQIMSHDRICIEGRGALLVLYRTRRRVRPNQISGFIDEVRALRGAFLEDRSRGVRYKLT